MARERGLEETRPSGNGRARGLVSSRASGRRIDVTTLAPPPELADVVEQFWCGRWDLPDDAPHTTEILGDPAVHLVFEDGSSRVVGVWTRLWTRTLEGRGEVRAVKLHPGACRAFLPSDAATYSNRLTPLGDVIEEAERLTRAVLDPSEFRDGVGALCDWLIANRDPEAHVARAVRILALVRDLPLTRVDELADAANLSVRALQRLFRSHVGASPKWVIRRVRLQQVALRVERGDAPDLAELAYDLGYADQAHLARDFRAATGQTLRAFEKTVR